MIDFLLGLGLLPMLVIATVFITQLCNVFKEIILGLAGAMIVLDSIIVLGYTFTLDFMTSNVNIYILGIGFSIMTSLCFKIFYMKKEFKWAYNMDYRTDINAKSN